MPVAAQNAGAAARVLLVEADLREARIISDTLRPAIPELVVQHGLTGGEADYHLLVANYDQLDEASVAKLFAAQRQSEMPAGLLLYSAKLDRPALIELFGTQGATNLLGMNPDVDPAELLVTIQKLLMPDVFGLERYFSAGGEDQRATITRSSERGTVIAAARQLAASVGAPRRLVESYVTVADEFLTNALYNAPVDEGGRRLFAHRSRQEDVELPEGKEIAVSMYSDGARLGIAVEDPYGSIRVEGIQKYLSKCFRRGTDQVDVKDGGAGLGLFYIFESLSQFVVNLEPGVRTEMIGLVDTRGRFRDFAARQKSFNVFVVDPAR